MCAEKTGSKPSIIQSVLTNRCPRCRRGKLFTGANPYNFKTTMKMPEECPVCGQRFELEPGFYFGTGYVSYALSIGVMATVFIARAVLLGLSYKDNSVFWSLGLSVGVLLLLQPVLQRLARSVWIAFFVKYDSDWKKRKGNSEVWER